MKGLSVWVSLILIVVGTVAALAGHLWEKTAELLHFFGKEMNENTGVRIMLGGIVAVLSGFGIFFLFR